MTTPEPSGTLTRIRIPRPYLWGALAALAILLAAWLVPLPPPVLSEDQLVAPRVPQTRATATTAETAFNNAETSYTAFVGTHDMDAILAHFKDALAAARAKPEDAGTRAQLADALAPVNEYLALLESYAQTGEAYLNALVHYDDDLMAWTRSLGPDSEKMRGATFTIVTVRAYYPQPIGDSTDPPLVKADQVMQTHSAAQATIDSLSKSPGGGAADVQAAEKVVADTWAEGHSIQDMESHNPQYMQYLQKYDRELQQLIATTGNKPAPSAPALALDALVGLVVLAGLAALLIPRAKLQERRA